MKVGRVDDDLHLSLRQRMAGEEGVVMLIGAADTGKTTLGRLLAADALAAGRRAAFVDADVAAATVGPPACVGMKLLATASDLSSLHDADALRFVGSVVPDSVVLPHVVAATALVDRARRDADLVVLDTTGVVDGVVGQTLKYHMMELCEPVIVVALQRGEEMEPIVGMLKRFLGARVARAVPPAEQVPVGPMERQDAMRKAFAAALPAPLERWRVQTTVFAPTLPEGFQLEKLAGMLVGIQDATGGCLGLGVLEHVDGVLRVATRHGEAMRGLRLGSMRLDLETYAASQVRLRQLFFGI
jgi:polynucleotide 5'-hydroxyl-kinase GRC3/NOL9